MNYCRQLRKYLKKHPGHARMLAPQLAIMDSAQYFSLPDGGSIIASDAGRVLVSEKLIRLPFEHVVIEYNPGDTPIKENPRIPPGHEFMAANRRIIALKDHYDSFLISAIWSYSGQPKSVSGSWWHTPVFEIKKSEFITLLPGGEFSINVIKNDPTITMYSSHGQRRFDELLDGAMTDISDEMAVVVNFLGALSCSNIGIDKIPDRPGSRRHTKKSIPYNDYHRLVIGGRAMGNSCGLNGTADDRRSPREHLRRGHIRRIDGDKFIWVNPTIVNAGTQGKILKNYAISK